MEKDRINIICEIGMNHMGDEAYADEYLKALGNAQPDGLTFQVREKEYYAKQKPGESPLLSDDFYRSAVARTRKVGITFGVAVCEAERVPFFEEIDTDFYKVLSKDIGNMALISAVLSTGKTVYISTGMSSEDELKAFLAGLGTPVPENLSFIHTQLSYNSADTNLRAIQRIRETLAIPTAFGLHSTDVNALYAALGFSPSALFFYVKGKCSVRHKDEEHAVTLTRCPVVITEIRRLETMLGDGVKKEMKNRIPDQTHET